MKIDKIPYAVVYCA